MVHSQIDSYFRSLKRDGEKTAPWLLAGILSNKLQKEGTKYKIKHVEGSKDLYTITLL